MRNSEAQRYARWSAAVATLLAVVVAGVYLRRVWQVRQAEKKGAARRVGHGRAVLGGPELTVQPLPSARAGRPTAKISGCPLLSPLTDL
jgi:hypothetical protein